LGSVITLTTDFGCADGYQGVLEGVIAGINPGARVVTISHSVKAGDIVEGWYLLKTHYPYFPPGTIHLAIVDPGVGGRRKIVTVRTARYTFVAPDNGLLAFIPAKEIISINSITNHKYALSSISPVFHGRDIMAPAAAYLSLGVDPSCLGKTVKTLTSLNLPRPVKTEKGIKGKILRIDRFGNLITNIESIPEKATIKVNGRDIGPLRKTFSDVKNGWALSYIGSGGHLEIAVRDGSAADHFSVTRKEDIEIIVER
jgi:hypothetical protein